MLSDCTARVQTAIRAKLAGKPLQRSACGKPVLPQPGSESLLSQVNELYVGGSLQPLVVQWLTK